MPLRYEHWQDRWSEGYHVYCGGLSIGIVLRTTFASNKEGWTWSISNVSIHGIAARDGKTQHLDEAKRDMEFAWSKWVSAAGLREASNGPPD